MKNKIIHASGFELAVITALLAAAFWPSLSLSISMFVPLSNIAFLVCGYIVLRHLLSAQHPLLARVLFATCSLILIVEILLFHFTQLHLNIFALSLILQPQAASQIGVSVRILLAPLIFMALAVVGSWQARDTIRIPMVSAVTLMASSFLIAHSLYAYLIFSRDSHLLSIQRHLVFFDGLHQYRATQIFTPLIGPRPENPFAHPHISKDITKNSAPTLQIKTKKNVLLIIIDSLRARDIAANPSLAPNLKRWSRRGDFSTSHNSVSNCTHFSLHTVFSGELATSFASARNSSTSQGLFASLGKSGYALSSSESQSLDWYDLSRIYLNTTERHIAQSKNKTESDQFVVDNSLNRLSMPATMPWAHLAYLSGPHFSYETWATSTLETYHRKIQETDKQLGRLLDGLSVAGSLENTLVIVTSDHGEQLAEEGIVGHGGILNNDQTVVPLLVLGSHQPVDWVKSHQDIKPFILSELGAQAAPKEPANFQILAGCDYEFPKSFAYISNEGRADFHFEDGVLSPTTTPEGHQASSELTATAGLKLINILQQSGETGLKAH